MPESQPSIDRRVPIDKQASALSRAEEAGTLPKKDRRHDEPAAPDPVIADAPDGSQVVFVATPEEPPADPRQAQVARLFAVLALIEDKVSVVDQAPVRELRALLTDLGFGKT